MIREDFLQQNAFITEDAYSSYGKQYRLLDLVLQYDAKCRAALGKGAEHQRSLQHRRARGASAARRWRRRKNIEKVYDGILDEMQSEIDEVVRGGEEQ